MMTGELRRLSVIHLVDRQLLHLTGLLKEPNLVHAQNPQKQYRHENDRALECLSYHGA